MSNDFQPDWTMPLSEYATFPTPMPKIKPLVWDKLSEVRFEAFNSMGAFCVYQCNGEVRVVTKPYMPNLYGTFEKIEEAKAWCQAEYERRVRECLE